MDCNCHLRGPCHPLVLSPGELMLTAIPKPTAFDINNRRSDKESDASKWLPSDALYDAYQDIEAKGVTKALAVAWYAPHPTKPGALVMRFRLFNESDNDGRALASELFQTITAGG